MRNTTLWCAIALGLGLAQPAAAVLRVSPSGVGSAVYVPYYTVENDRSSLLTVSNSSDQPTMVRVLFAEAQNGQSVMSFNVMLPAQSVWSATVSALTEAAKVTSQSSVCTVPVLATFAPGFTFVNFDYAHNHPDGGSTGNARVRTGAVEVIELGALTGALGEATAALDCEDVMAAYVNTGSGVPVRTGQILAPTGMISAKVNVIEVVKGLINTIEGVAIEGFSEVPQDVTGDDYLPRISTPSLGKTAFEFVVDGPNGRLVFASNRGPDAISSLFMRSEIGGEFYTNPLLGASTRWVVSLPTKHAYVSARPGSLTVAGQPRAPFADFFDANGSCDSVTTREKRFGGTAQQAAGDPILPSQTALCGQVNVIDFVRPPFADGTKRFQFADVEQRTITAQRPDGTVVVLRGLPAIGTQFSNFVNGQVQPGVLANYSITQTLRSKPAPASE